MFGKIILAVATIAMIASPSMGALLLNEPFSYADGSLTTVSGGTWVNHSGTGSFLQVTGGSVDVIQGGGSREDAHRVFGVTSGVIYSAFDVTVDVANTAVYFAHLWNSSDVLSFRSRVWVQPDPSGAGDFTLAISDTSTAGSQVPWGSGLDFGTKYRVVHSYDLTTGATKMWVDQATDAGTSVSAVISTAVLAGMDAHALRQAGGTSTQDVDNLCVGNTYNEAYNCVPEPATIGLLSFGALALIRRRR